MLHEIFTLLPYINEQWSPFEICYYVESFFQREDIVCIPVEMKEILEVGILTVYQVKKIIKFKKKKKNTYRGG